jgi:diguanylate cyclase (GGDEF)-like protein
MDKNRGTQEWLDFVVDTLKHLDEGVQARFLQEFLLGLASLEVSEKEGVSHWEGVLAHQSQLVAKLGRPVTLRTAAVDYFGELRILRNPILMEYDELRKLRHSASTDPLTGLNNRRIFDEYLLREINRTNRYGSSFALLSVDLRKFKSVNDTYGHAAGDEILRSVARAILETIRGSDISCRIGGDEFAVLLLQAERPSSQVLAVRIARKFKEHANAFAPNSPVAIDYGIGIFPEDGHDAATLFAAADKNLYANKQRAHRHQAIPFPAEGTTPQIEDREPEVETEADSGEEPRSLIALPSASFARTGGGIRASDPGLSARKDERVRLEGAPALGIVRVGETSRTVRVLDLSRGGVCLLVDETDLPDNFPARLQVPVAPGGELPLHRIYSHLLSEGKRRVGCSFSPRQATLSV